MTARTATELQEYASSAEPLVIRANAGDCVKVKLTNKLPAAGLPDHSGDVPLPAAMDPTLGGILPGGAK